MGDTNFDSVDVSEGYKVDGTEIIDGDGDIAASALGVEQYVILKPDVAVDTFVAAEDISGGGTIVCTLARTISDYPRNLFYTLTDAAATTLVGAFTTVGTDQFGVAATETVTVTVATATAVAGTQIFSTITSITVVLTNAAASDTADVGVSIVADVASFGLPKPITAVTDVMAVNWVDNGTSKTQNIDATSVVVARDCFRPEQTVAAADDYILLYDPT